MSRYEKALPDYGLMLAAGFEWKTLHYFAQLIIPETESAPARNIETFFEQDFDRLMIWLDVALEKHGLTVPIEIQTDFFDQALAEIFEDDPDHQFYCQLNQLSSEGDTGFSVPLDDGVELASVVVDGGAPGNDSISYEVEAGNCGVNADDYVLFTGDSVKAEQVLTALRSAGEQAHSLPYQLMATFELDRGRG